MTKTTVRFAAVGTVLLLGALAMALAQHDARQRPRETSTPAKLVAEAPQPILLDDVDPTWLATDNSSGAGQPLVRANDDRAPGAPPSLAYEPVQSAAENPLRPLASFRGDADLSSDNPSGGDASGGHMVEPLSVVADGSAVAQAAGEGPLSSVPSLPTLPPSFAAAPLVDSAVSASLPGSPDLAATPKGLDASPQPQARSAPPGWVNSGPVNTNRTLSDTQRPALPTSNLPSTPPQGGQGWLQALPAVPGDKPLLSQGTGSTKDSPIPQRLLPVAPSATLGAPQATGSVSSGAPPAAGTRGPLVSTHARTLLGGSALGSLISNQPGNRHLDGSQNPVMLIQKRMAGECQVGKRATVVITVRNAGNSTAQDVEVIDSVPVGASFAEAIPAVTPTADGILVWPLGEMAPGDERTINLQIIPERQGELGSTAVVRFAAQASVRTLATLPKLELTQSSSPEVLIGSPHAIDVVVKNVGTGVARGVRLEADLPTNVRHEYGDASLEASFGDLAPNESKHIRLESMATEPGQGLCSIRALTEDGLQQEQKVNLRVLAPALEATIMGPSLRYLDRQATFQIMIKNTGTAAATNCEFALRLPTGLNFNTANCDGLYNPEEHAVFWSLPEFPAGLSEAVELTLLPVEVGTQAMTFQGSADLGVKAEAKGSLSVIEQGELAFTIEQDADPIEVSASTWFTVTVRNIGRVDHNVQLAMQLPSGSKALKVDAPVKHQILGDQLVFEPIPQMDSRAVQKIRVEVGNFQIGTQIVRAQLKSQNRPTPVIKEEATDVYNDRN